MRTTAPLPLLPLALAALALGGAGCSISPKPEPPDTTPIVDPSVVTISPVRDYNDPGGIQGGPGSVSPASGAVRIWLLDSEAAPIDAPVAPDGSFVAYFDVNIGDEVRLQVIDGQQRSVPVDLAVTSTDGPAQPAQRPLGDCLFVGLEAVFPSQTGVRVANTCSVGVTIAQPAFRRAVSGLGAGQGQSWPMTIASGTEAMVSIDVQPNAGSFEEILFVTATQPQWDRRPVTVRGSVP